MANEAPAIPDGFEVEAPDPVFQRNAPFARKGPWETKLSPQEEPKFQDWVKANKVPFDSSQPNQDYDMRGYWKDVASKGRSETGVNPVDKQLHFPDTYKTPYHESFSNESKYATPNTPFKWQGENLIDQRTGKPVFQTKAPLSDMPALPSGFEVEKHPAPNPMLDTGSPELAEEAQARGATARTIKQHEKTVAQVAAPIAASFVTSGLAAPYTAGIAFDGAPALSMAVRHIAGAGALLAGQDVGAAATGQDVTLGDSAKNLGLYTALGLTGELPGALLSTASKSPAVIAALEKARLAAGKVGPRTAGVADKVVDFFKQISPELSPDQLAAARQSADEGNKIADKVKSVTSYHGKKLQAGLRNDLGDLLDTTVGRDAVEDPVAQAFTNKPYLKQGISPRMQSLISKFTPEGAAQSAQESPLTNTVAKLREGGASDSEIRGSLKRDGAKPIEIRAAMATPADADAPGFFSKPDYTLDDLTQIRSKINSAVHTGSQYEGYDKDFAQYMNENLRSTIHESLSDSGASTQQIGRFDQFFKDWAAHKNLQDAMEMAATGTIGIEQADKLWSIAGDVSDKNGAEKFGQFLSLAKELDASKPTSNVLPTVREAFNLRLSKAYSLGDTPEASRKNVFDALQKIPLETRMKVFGTGSPMVDANRMAKIVGQLDDTSLLAQAKAAGKKLATSPRGVSPYIRSMIAFGALKATFGSRDKRGLFQTLMHPKPEDLLMAGTAIAVGFRGPQMFRAIMSYANVPLQRAYATMLEHPGDPKALETFARGLSVAVGAGQGAVAGGQSGHPYLGAAVGAALQSINLPGMEGTGEGTQAPQGGPPTQPAPPALPEPPIKLRPTGMSPMGERIQGFKRIGDPVAGTPPAEPSTAPPPVSGQLPVPVQDNPRDIVAFLKSKTAPAPRINLNRPPPLRTGAAVALPPSDIKPGPEGPGQFVTRPGVAGTITPKPAEQAPAPAPAAPPEPVNDLFGKTEQPAINTDFRKMRIDPTPTRFESPASALERNPERWQFKESNVEGLTDALSGVKHYDPIQGGDLIAYYDPASEKLEVIDGHQRHYLAKEDGDSKVPYYVLDGGNNFKGALAHGVTPEAARAYAAVRNLRAGTGSSLDAAKFIRDTGLKLEDLKDLNVPVSKAQTKDGMALSNLDDNVFREVAQHRFPERMGVILGTELPGNPVQTDILKQVREAEAKGKEVSPLELQEWIRMAKGSSGDQIVMDDMFGKRLTETNFREMGQVSKYVLKNLRTSKLAFNYVGKHAELLKTGNTIVDEDTGMLMSKDAANRTMMYKRVGYEPDSGTHKIIDETATKLKGATSVAQERRLLHDAYQRIQKVLPEDFDRAVEAVKAPSDNSTIRLRAALRDRRGHITHGGIGSTHSEVYRRMGEPPDVTEQGYVDPEGKWLSRADARKIEIPGNPTVVRKP